MSISGEEVIRKSAALRGARKFDKAIDLIESNIHSIDSDLRCNAWLEAFRAAVESGDRELAKKYAQKVEAEDPDVPSIQEYIQKEEA